MKSIIVILGLITAVFTLKVNAQHEHHNMSDQGNESSTASAPTFENKKLGEAYQNYTHLKSALVSSDVTESKMGAKMLAASLKEVQGANDTSELAAKIANSDDLDDQRIVFAELSDKMYELVKGQLASGEIYQTYCPMANGNNGAYWLSNEKTIRNPYFGDKMMSCGSVKETLK